MKTVITVSLLFLASCGRGYEAKKTVSKIIQAKGNPQNKDVEITVYEMTPAQAYKNLEQIWTGRSGLYMQYYFTMLGSDRELEAKKLDEMALGKRRKYLDLQYSTKNKDVTFYRVNALVVKSDTLLYEIYFLNDQYDIIDKFSEK